MMCSFLVVLRVFRVFCSESNQGTLGSIASDIELANERGVWGCLVRLLATKNGVRVVVLFSRPPRTAPTIHRAPPHKTTPRAPQPFVCYASLTHSTNASRRKTLRGKCTWLGGRRCVCGWGVGADRYAQNHTPGEREKEEDRVAVFKKGAYASPTRCVPLP